MTIPILTLTFAPDAPIKVELSAPLHDDKIDPARRMFADWAKQWRALTATEVPINRPSTDEEVTRLVLSHCWNRLRKRVDSIEVIDDVDDMLTVVVSKNKWRHTAGRPLQDARENPLVFSDHVSNTLEALIMQHNRSK